MKSISQFIQVKIQAAAKVTGKATWNCRICLRSFKLPPDFEGDERFESVCAECVIVKLVFNAPYNSLKNS